MTIYSIIKELKKRRIVKPRLKSFLDNRKIQNIEEFNALPNDASPEEIDLIFAKG